MRRSIVHQHWALREQITLAVSQNNIMLWHFEHEYRLIGRTEDLNGHAFGVLAHPIFLKQHLMEVHLLMEVAENRMSY